jgi:hypothetical protein
MAQVWCQRFEMRLCDRTDECSPCLGTEDADWRLVPPQTQRTVKHLIAKKDLVRVLVDSWRRVARYQAESMVRWIFVQIWLKAQANLAMALTVPPAARLRRRKQRVS